MKLSKQILWAGGIGLAILVGSSACVIEERDIEAKETFVCTADTDCLSGSVCVLLPNTTQGRCTREEEVQRCHDYDGDGYFATDKGYEGACGSLSANERDCNDGNRNIYPREFEDACDGLDNNCDGCIDGTCPKDKDCFDDKTLCEPIVRTCHGLIFKGVCAKEVAGYRKCVDGAFVEGHDVGGVFTARACLSADEVGYVSDEATAADKDAKYCDTKDNDCNGIVDDYYLDSQNVRIGCKE